MLIIFTIVAIILIISADVAANVKMFMALVTLPGAFGMLALLIFDDADFRDDVAEVEIEASDNETVESISVEDEDIRLYIDEWIELLHLGEVDQEYMERIRRERQIQNIYQDIHDMAAEANKRIDELCKV